jgi:hypothetical protein
MGLGGEEQRNKGVGRPIKQSGGELVVLRECNGLPVRKNALNERIAVTPEPLKKDTLLLQEILDAHSRLKQSAELETPACGGFEFPGGVGVTAEPQGSCPAFRDLLPN